MEENKDNLAAEQEQAANSAAEETAGREAGQQPPKPKKKPKEDPTIKLGEEIAELKDQLLRAAAEFDNYKKRTAKEKEGIYHEAVCAVVGKILPVIDCLERAALAEGDADSIRQGIVLTLKQFSEVCGQLGVNEIEAVVGEPVDPNQHNVLMRAEDSGLPEGSIAEVLAKGYKVGDRVIRYTMVKSAN